MPWALNKISERVKASKKFFFSWSDLPEKKGHNVVLKKLGLPMTHYDSYLVAPWQLELPSPEKMFYSEKVRTITDESLKAQEYNISSPDPGIRVFVLKHGIGFPNIHSCPTKKIIVFFNQVKRGHYMISIIAAHLICRKHLRMFPLMWQVSLVPHVFRSISNSNR